MKELILVTEKEGQQLVDAKELWNVLESKTEVAKWIKRRILNNSYFTEDEDYTFFVKYGEKGRPSNEYTLTLDTAKKIAMAEQTIVGNKVREYFILCEKKVKELIKTLTVGEQLVLNAQLLLAQEKKLLEHDDRIKELEVKTTTRPDYFTVAGYATKIGERIGLKIAAKIGRKASAICKKFEYHIDKVDDPRFGMVNVYPKEILEKIWREVG